MFPTYVIYYTKVNEKSATANANCKALVPLKNVLRNLFFSKGRGSKVAKQKRNLTVCQIKRKKKSNRKAIQAQISELLISQHGFNPNMTKI
jgi:hypothetical protein